MRLSLVGISVLGVVFLCKACRMLHFECFTSSPPTVESFHSCLGFFQSLFFVWGYLILVFLFGLWFNHQYFRIASFFDMLFCLLKCSIFFHEIFWILVQIEACFLTHASARTSAKIYARWLSHLVDMLQTAKRIIQRQIVPLCWWTCMCT